MRRDNQEYVTRKDGIWSAIAVVAFDKDDNLILINRYYPSVRSCVLELPTMPFDAYLSFSQAASKRLEDYGYGLTEPPTVVGRVASSPGLTNDIIYFLLATNVEKVSDNENSAEVILAPTTAEVPAIIQEVLKGRRLASATVFTGLSYVGFTEISK